MSTIIIRIVLLVEQTKHPGLRRDLPQVRHPNRANKKGIQNATMIYVICSTCDNIINEINEVVKNQEASKKDDPDDNKATEVGENSG